MRVSTDLVLDGISAFNNITNGDQIGAFAGIDPSMIGLQPFKATPLELGTKFVSPTGTGSAYTDANPGPLQGALYAAVPGDVIFLKGGMYIINSQIQVLNDGLPDNRITIESYPGQLAILDASAMARNGASIRVNLQAGYVTIRNLEIIGMVKAGIYVSSSYNIIEHNVVHGCALTGINVYKDYDNPQLSSHNVIRSNLCYANSDAGLFGGEYADGDNSDGISVSTGEFNIVEHNVCYGNSDDGIDIWRSSNTIVRYNITYQNGIGGAGNGNGIKAGGHATSDKGNLVEHNISFRNRSLGFTYNSSTYVTFNYNTSYGNAAGYDIDGTTIMLGNVSISESRSILDVISSSQKNNSWQRDTVFVPKSTDISSPGFMQLKELGYPTYERISKWSGCGNSNAIITMGEPSVGTVGSVTASNIGTSSIYAAVPGVEILVNTASTTAVACLYGNSGNKWFRGYNALPGAGGFDFFCRFGIATGAAATNRIFAGLAGSQSAPTDVNPSTLLDIIGICADSADANLSIMFNDNAGTATKINLGTSFAKPTVDNTGVFEVRIFCYPMSGEIYYTARNVVTGVVKAGFMYSNLPAAATLMSPRAWVSVGGVNSVVGLKLSDMCVKTRI